MVDINIRRADLTDEAAIRHIIKDSFYGIDNLYHYFRRYVTHPNYLSYVLEEDGKVVSYQYAYLVDEQSTAVRGGFRTDSSARHRNYMHMLRDFIDKRLQEINTITREAYVVLKTPFQTERLDDPNKKLVSLRSIFSFEGSMDSLRNALNGTKQSINSCGISSVVDNILKPNIKKQLFPDDIVIVWEPYLALTSNFDMFKDICTTRVSRNSSDHDINMVTFTQDYFVLSGVRIDIECYGADLELLFEHIVSALIDVVHKYENYNGAVFVTILCQLKMVDSYLKILSKMSSLGFVEGEWTKNCKEYCVVHTQKSPQ